VSDNDTSGPGGTLINFPRIGFNLNPTTTLPDPSGPVPDNTDDDTPAPRRPGRRSPLDALAALPSPGLTLPVLPNPALVPQPGHVPATFHNDPDDPAAGTPGLGALSMAATLAVAIACLRGTHTVLSTWWENRQARLADTAPLREARLKHQAAMQGIADKAAQQRAKSNRVPSSSEFGRKTLSRTSGGGGGGRSSGGSGKSGGLGTGASKRSGAGSKTSSGSGSGLFGGGKKPSGTSNSRSGGSKSPMNRGAGGGGGRGPGGKNRSPKSNSGASQGGGAGSRKQNRPSPSPGGSGSGGSGRKTLASAAGKQAQKAAARRLKRRRKNLNNPVLWGGSNSQGKNGPKTNSPKSNTPKGNGPGSGPKRKKIQLQKNGPTTGGPGTTGTSRTRGRTTLSQAARKQAVKAAARRWKRRQHQWKAGHKPPIWTTPNTPGSTSAKTTNGPGSNTNTPKTPKTKTRKKTKKTAPGSSYWNKVRNRRRKQQPPAGGGPAGGGPTGGRRGRKSPWQAAGQAGVDPTITVQRADNVGDQARRWEPSQIGTGPKALPSTGPAALDAAPTKTFPRPSTSRPKEPRPMPPAPGKPDARIVKARNQAARTGRGVIADARHMDAQHATEITLDDAIDEYDDFKDDAFKTHDQCAKLADRAIRLRDILLDFAEELAVKHNLIGALFSRAMARLAESMDLLARMAEEMKTSSLEAAEMAEAAANDLNDAYRPYNVATADAGLSTPSAPIHNEA